MPDVRENFKLSADGAATVAVRDRWQAAFAGDITDCLAVVGTAPVDEDLVFEVRIDGEAVLTGTIEAGATEVDVAVPTPIRFAKNQTVDLNITQTGLANEVQTITEGGAGLTSFVLHFDGQDTASIDDDATALQVQTALEALSNIAPGDVVVTGGPLGTGPFSVTFGGTLKGTNVAQMTATPTGGSGTVTIATGTAGGSGTAGANLDVTVEYVPL